MSNISIWEWLWAKLEHKDLFSKPITFTYKGHSVYRTAYGGTISLLIEILLFIIGIIFITTIFKHTNSNKSINIEVKDLSLDQTKRYIGKSTFAFGVKYLSSNPDIIFDATYFNFQMVQATYIREDGGYITRTSEPIEYEECGDKFDNFVSEDLITLMGLETYIWPKNTDYYLQSNYNSRIFRSIEILISRCSNSTSGNTCQSNETIDAAAIEGLFDVALVSAHLDFNDYKTPIKTYLEDLNTIPMIPGITQTLQVKMKYNEFLSSDNLFYGGQYSNQKFFQVGEKRSRLASEDGYNKSLLTWYLTLDQQVETYERNVFTFLDLFGFLGGLFEVLFLIGYLFNEILANKVMMNNIFSDYFHTTIEDSNENNQNTENLKATKSLIQDENQVSSQIDEEKDDNTSQIEFNEAFKKESENWNINELEDHNNCDEQCRDSLKLSDRSWSKNSSKTENKTNDISKSQTYDQSISSSENTTNPSNFDYEKIIDSLKVRWRYDFSITQILISTLPKCKWLRKSKSKLSPKFTKLSNQEMYSIKYKAGLNKFTSETDIISILDALNQSKMLIKILLKEHQQNLMMFSQHKLIDSSNSSKPDHQRNYFTFGTHKISIPNVKDKNGRSELSTHLDNISAQYSKDGLTEIDQALLQLT